MYSIENEVIKATYKGVTDSFDFRGMPDGEVPYSIAKNSLEIETVLEVVPIVSAKKEDGVLSVELLQYIAPDASDAEKFPEWFEVR